MLDTLIPLVHASEQKGVGVWESLVCLAQRLISVVTHALPCWHCSPVWSRSWKEDVLHVPRQPGPCQTVSRHSPPVNTTRPAIGHFMCLCTLPPISQTLKYNIAWVCVTVSLARRQAILQVGCLVSVVVNYLGRWIYYDSYWLIACWLTQCHQVYKVMLTPNSDGFEF